MEWATKAFKRSCLTIAYGVYTKKTKIKYLNIQCYEDSFLMIILRLPYLKTTTKIYDLLVIIKRAN